MNLKLIEEAINNSDFYCDNSFCDCEEKIIRQPQHWSDNSEIFYCEKCNRPILVKDANKIIDDWRHINLERR